MHSRIKTAAITMAIMLLIASHLVAGTTNNNGKNSKDRAGKRPQVEVCFVLDTTGSMSGLIEGAKAKIWAIANQMIAAEPTPDLRIGLIGYRDRGDEYVTRVFDLSDDIDTVYANLRSFEAAGGGDTPESVNQALHEAVTRMSWSKGTKALKVVFLVGDCPPHMDYGDDVKYPDTCKSAVTSGLIINTIQCGSHSDTTPIWQEISRRSEGSYVAIGQTGDMRIVETPMDDELARLNVALGETMLPYGGESRRREVMAKQALAEAAPAAATADRLAFNMTTGKVVQGGGDLLDDVAGGVVELEELKKDELPAELRELEPAKRDAFLKERSAKREAIKKQIAELVTKREAYIRAELERVAADGEGSGFDLEVAEMLREQGARKGISY